MIIKHKKGFTLIELIVVIAIIGILSAIIIAFVTDARQKAKDAAIVQSLESIRNPAAFYFETNNPPEHYVETYGPPTNPTCVQPQCTQGNFSDLSGVCNSPEIKSILQNIIGIAGGQRGAYCTVGTVDASERIRGTSFEADFKLFYSGQIFCVDSSGFAGITPAPTRATWGTPAHCN